MRTTKIEATNWKVVRGCSRRSALRLFERTVALSDKLINQLNIDSGANDISAS